MKIALVSPYDWAVPGGVNSHINQLGEQLIRSGHDVRIIAPSSRRWSHRCDYLTVIGEHVIGLPASGSVANVCLSFDLAPRVKTLLASERFDVIHVHEPFQPLLPFQFLRYADTPVVATFHATRDSGSRLYAYIRYLIKPWWGHIQGRIAVSRTALKMIGRYFPDRYSIIPNGIDYPHFASEVSPIAKYIDGKRNILFVGRQEKRKGLPYLLEAYARLKRERPDIRLIVVGPDGGMRPACERYVRQHRLEDVVFTDFVPYEELPRYYKTADIYCAPNTGHESFGIVLLEAMAAGTPIVASDIGGFGEVLEHGVEGMLVPPRDAEALATAMDSLLSDATLREQMGRAGTMRAEPYGWDHVSAQVLDYYRATANGAASAGSGP